MLTMAALEIGHPIAKFVHVISNNGLLHSTNLLHTLMIHSSDLCYTRGRMLTQTEVREDVRQQIIGQIPAGRLAMPGEIADAVAFLASDKASYITGTNLSVNGGLHMYA